MGYTIVYDRLFIRAGDKYVPLCLYGSNNVTVNVNGREVRERRWELFSYCDEMIFADKDSLMREVRDRHTSERSKNFKFRSKWLENAAVIRFFENGIKNAVTIEGVRQCRNDESLHAKLACWPKDGSWKRTNFEKYLHTSDELVDWLSEAKDLKAKMLSTGEWSSIYICCGFDGRDPIRVIPRSKDENPVIAKDALHGNGYVSSVQMDKSGWRCSAKIADAMVFANAKEAYERLPEYPFRLISAKQKDDAGKKNWVLSVLYGQSRVYIHRLSRGRCKYVYAPVSAEKRFASEKEAFKWYEEKIQPHYPALTDPVAVNLDEILKERKTE